MLWSEQSLQSLFLQVSLSSCLNAAMYSQRRGYMDWTQEVLIHIYPVCFHWLEFWVWWSHGIINSFNIKNILLVITLEKTQKNKSEPYLAISSSKHTYIVIDHPEHKSTIHKRKTALRKGRKKNYYFIEKTPIHGLAVHFVSPVHLNHVCRWG